MKQTPGEFSMVYFQKKEMDVKKTIYLILEGMEDSCPIPIREK